MATLYSDVMQLIVDGKESFVGTAGSGGRDKQGEYKLPVATFTTTATTAATDVIQMVQVPANHIITKGYLRWEDLGTDVTLDCGITGGVVDAFVDGAVGGTAGWIRFYDAAAPTVAADYAAGIITTQDTVDILVIDGGSISITAGQDIELHCWVQALENT